MAGAPEGLSFLFFSALTSRNLNSSGCVLLVAATLDRTVLPQQFALAVLPPLGGGSPLV